MPSDLLPFVILAFNILLSLVAFFGGMVIRGLREDVKSLRAADEKMAEKFDGFTRSEDFREFRMEQNEFRKEIRDMFDQVYSRIDLVKDTLSRKADRKDL